jgi:radical SAM superfamily enzyme YgiQ (UPF0313 family)
MQVCLVNAPTAAEFRDALEFKSELLRHESSEPQLGILSLAAVLETCGCSPRIVDLNRAFYRYADSVSESEIDGFAEVAASEISAVDVDVYGFGSICSAYPLTLRIAKLVKLLRPESIIVFGGPQASVVSVQTLSSFPFVDFVLRGETEVSMPVLLEEFNGQRRFNKVPGLTFHSPLGVQRTPDAPLIMDLDTLPSPAYHLTEELRGLDRASLELGRGCPFACTFCSTNDFFRRKFRLRSPERILKDMRALESKYGIRDFNLVHDMFTVDVKRVQTFCHALIESGEGYTWSCSARTDSVDEDLIALMAAAGCTSMFFGVETGSKRMQRIIDKHLDTGRAHEIIDIVERAGIRSTISLITGFPQETVDDLRDTVRMFMHAARVPGSEPQLNLLAPLANTPLHIAYKNQMTLDMLCSDISHQGRYQNAEEIELIRRYPEIFPNFYLLPTPELDRRKLLELREFTLMAELRFRWLMGAADQASTGILDLFFDWAERREALYPALAGPDLRHYYRTPQFPLDFIAFLRSHSVGETTVLKAFLDFEDALSLAQSPDASRLSRVVRLDLGEAMDWSDIPIRNENSRVIQLTYELEKAIDAVRNRQEPEWENGLYFYVVAQAPREENPIYQVSSRIAATVEACNGKLTISDLVSHLSTTLPGTIDARGDYSILLLIEKAWVEGLIEIYRTVAEAAESQDAAASISEYSEMSALASLQNHPSIQAL